MKKTLLIIGIMVIAVLSFAYASIAQDNRWVTLPVKEQGNIYNNSLFGHWSDNIFVECKDQAPEYPAVRAWVPEVDSNPKSITIYVRVKDEQGQYTTADETEALLIERGAAKSIGDIVWDPVEKRYALEYVVPDNVPSEFTIKTKCCRGTSCEEKTARFKYKEGVVTLLDS